MIRRVLITFSAAAMLALAVGATSASANSVTVNTRPVLTLGPTLNGKIKVYGGQTSAQAATNQKTGNTSVGSQVTRTVDIAPSVDPENPLDQDLWQYTNFLGYQYQWYKYDGSTYTLIAPSTNTYGQSGTRNFARSTVGYKVAVRQTPFYSDPNDGDFNVSADRTTTNDLSYSDVSQSPVVTFFATTDPTASSIVSNKIRITGYGVWQGYVTGSTKTKQWVSCTSSTDLNTCTDIGGATGSTQTLTSAQNGTFIRVKVTLTTTQGFGTSESAYSNAVGYNLVG